MVSGATDISTDSGRSRSTNPGIALSCSPSLDVTMAPFGSTGHSDLYDPICTLTPTWLRVMAQTPDICMALGSIWSHG